MSLFDKEVLLAAYKKWEVTEAAKAATTPVSAFKYHPRSREQWQSRVNQNRNGSPVPLAPAVPPVEGESAITSVGGFVEKRREYICCATCGHWRSRHCTKRIVRAPKPGSKPRRAKWTVTDSGAILHERDKWKGFRDERGEVQPCQHTTLDGKDYACNSTACATDGCDCQKFVNPLTPPRKSRKKKIETLAAVQAELFQIGEQL